MPLKIFAGLLAAFLSLAAWAGPTLKIAGQEGDERFFPLIRTIYQRMGYAVDFDLFPSARALSLVDSGTYDAEIGRVREIEKDYQGLHFSNEPLLSVHLLALTKKGFQPRLSNAAGLAERRIGYVIGMSVAETFAKAKRLDSIAVSTHEQLAQMLDSGRIDVVLMGTGFPQSPVYKVGVDRFDLATLNVFHIFSTRHADLAAAFDRTLQQMKKEGTYDKLLAPSSAPQP